MLAPSRLARGPFLPQRPLCDLISDSQERYLKGYLISRSWKLERVHDLNRLLDLCLDHSKEFSRFAPLAQSLTEQFWAQHYPGDDLSEVGEDYNELRKDAQELIDLIKKQMG